jgi:GT2 family glycosyltransferase
VIVNYNAGPVLVDCLDAVLWQAAEVVVVDNASDPQGFEPVIGRFLSHPRLRLIRSATNLGFAAGCNAGTALATQPLVFYLNPDCIVAPGALERLCVALDEHPGAAMAGGLLTALDGSEQGGGRRAVPTPWRAFVRAFGLARLSWCWPGMFDDFHLHREPLPEAPIAVEAISGACMLIRRAALAEIGPLDEGYFLHCEDLDLCMRIRAGGRTILFVPDAPIVHHKGVCSRGRPVFVEWHKHKGMIRFYRKHFRQRYPSGLMELVTCGVWLRFSALAAGHLGRRLRDAIRRGRRPAAWGGPLETRPAGAEGVVLPIPRVTQPLAS